MQQFQRFISYLLHPLYIPFIGTVAYFLITPKYIPLKTLSGNILPIFILTIVIPIIFYLILRNLGLVSSVFIPNLKERKYPLYISLGLFLLIFFKVIPTNFIIELHYYFLGLSVAIFCAIILLFLKFKCSIHLLGMGSLLMYLINLSIHFETNIITTISIVSFLCGLAASSRLYLNAHSKAALFIGFVIGLISQLLTIKFWL